MIRSQFLSAVEFAARASGRSAYPETEMLHLEASKGRGRVTGTNLDMFTRQQFDSSTDLSCCVSARRLKTVLSLCPDESIGLEVDDKRLTITGQGFRQVIDTMPTKDFPSMLEVDGEDFPIPCDALKKCVPAICDDPSKPMFQSVYLDPSGAVVALNGKSLHCVDGVTIPTGAVLPPVIAVLLSGLSGSMRVGGGRFSAAGEAWSVSGKLIEGEYIKWRNALRRAENEVPVPDGMIESIALAVGCSSEPMNPRAIFEGGEVSLPGSTVACGFDTGFKFAINPEVLRVALKTAGAGASIGFSSPLLPFTIRNGNFFAMVTPQRPEL